MSRKATFKPLAHVKKPDMNKPLGVASFDSTRLVGFEVTGDNNVIL